MFLPEATDGQGWIYQPATENVLLDWPGWDDGGGPLLRLL